MSDKPKLTKELLNKIATIATDKYLNNGHCDDSLYLNPKEIVARAYVEATLAVLQSRGFILTQERREK